MIKNLLGKMLLVVATAAVLWGCGGVERPVEYVAVKIDGSELWSVLLFLAVFRKCSTWHNLLTTCPIMRGTMELLTKRPSYQQFRQFFRFSFCR